MPNNVHHFGVVVSNLERSLEFYSEVLGADIVRRRTIFSERDAAGIARAAGAEGHNLNVAFLSAPNALIELIEYDSKGRRDAPSPANVGAPHICVAVADIDLTYQRLFDKGIEFYATPYKIEEGFAAGVRFAYVRDPDGISLELISDPPKVDA